MNATGVSDPTGVSERKPTQLLAGGRVVTPAGVLPDAWVQVAGGRITAVDTGPRRPDAGAPVVDLAGAWLLPGFVDLHMHGGGGHSVADSPQAMADAVAFHRGHGTTATLVSLMTAPEAELTEQLGWAAELTRRAPGGQPGGQPGGKSGGQPGGNPGGQPGDKPGGHVLGSHLEGPFLSARRCGAQNQAHMAPPDPLLLERLRAAAGETLRMVTVAPELDGALPLIQTLSAAGVTVALGHSDATYDEAWAGIRAGASHATHLFNAMRPLHHREPGVAGAALEADISCELINDGMHLHPMIVRMVCERISTPVLVTDAIAAAGVGDGQFELGGQDVHVHDGAARLAATGALAGSTLTMDRALRLAVEASGLSVERASAAASAHPARVLGLERELGSIAPGRRADLVVLDDQLELTRVMAGGVWIG